MSIHQNRLAAEQVFAEAMQFYRQRTAQSQHQAIQKWQESLNLWREVGDRYQQAQSLTWIGFVYSNLGNRQQAQEYLNQALPLWQALGEREWEARTLNNIGLVCSNLGEKNQALDYYNQALPLMQEVGNHAEEAAILNNIGKIYSDLGNKNDALNYYNRALFIRQEQNDRRGEGVTLNNIAGVFSDLGNKKQALEYYNQALLIRREVGDQSGEAVTLNNIGLVYSDLGEKQHSQDYYQEALQIRQEVGDRSGVAETLNNIGLLYFDLGEFQQALNSYKQALELMRTVGNRRGEAVTLNNIGGVYSNLGEFQQALEYYSQALPIRQSVGDRRGEATALTNIAAISDTLGEKQFSLDYYQKALELWLAIGNRTGVAKTLDNIGVVYFDLGEFQQALDYYNQALPIRKEVGDRRGEAITLNNIGVVYSCLGMFQQALEYYNEALPIKREVGDISGTVTTLRNIAVAERNLGNFNEALAQIESAIATIETLRTKVISQDLRASYLASVRHYYEFYIDLLMQLHQKNQTVGYAVKALEVSERARARSLVELLEEARADIRQGVDPKLRDCEIQLQQQLASKTQALQKLLQGRLPEEIEAAEVKQMETFTKEINSLQIQLREVEAEIRIKSPRYAALKYPLPLSAQEIQQQVVDDETTLLSYWLGDERSYLWAITSTLIASHELPKSSDIEATAREFYEYLTVPEKREKPKKVAQITNVLSQILLEPVTAHLRCKRLLIVSDGVVQRYVPFSALLDPLSPDFKPMFVEHEIVSLPSASTLTQIRRDQGRNNCATKTVAVLADPVFDKTDERVKVAPVRAVASQTQTSPSLLPLELLTRDIGCTDGEQLFPRLPFSRLEAEEIQKLVSKESSLLALDFDASRETAISPQLSQYRYVHFATHGFYNDIHPELSGIALSLINEQGEELKDGFLLTPDVFNLNLPAEMVILSGCRTAEGKEVKGEGIVGLTRGLMYAGARRVVVSLWSVSDRATAEFMGRFYRGILQEGLSPTKALRATQLEMWQHKQWQEPYYWAAFVLQGEYQ